MTYAELRHEADEVDLRWRRYTAAPPAFRHFVTAEMKDWVQVVADDYPTAFRTLFDQWSPDERLQIGDQRAIED